MKVKTSELTGAALDWAVAKCEGLPADKWGVVWVPVPTEPHFNMEYKPSTKWSQGGPIIERENIELSPPFTAEDGTMFGGWHGTINNKASQLGPTPLIAAMRCYVASKLGDEVEIPEELL